MMARLDKGADVSHPDDWNGKVLPFTHQITGDIYHCTISIEERSADLHANVVCVDMRKVLEFFKDRPTF